MRRTSEYIACALSDRGLILSKLKRKIGRQEESNSQLQHLEEKSYTLLSNYITKKYGVIRIGDEEKPGVGDEGLSLSLGENFDEFEFKLEEHNIEFSTLALATIYFLKWAKFNLKAGIKLNPRLMYLTACFIAFQFYEDVKWTLVEFSQEYAISSHILAKFQPFLLFDVLDGDLWPNEQEIKNFFGQFDPSIEKCLKKQKLQEIAEEENE